MLVHMVPRMTARKDLEWRREGTSKGTLYASTRIIQDLSSFLTQPIFLLQATNNNILLILIYL